MNCVSKYDSLEWLEDHGYFISPIETTPGGKHWIAWEAHGGLGLTTESANVESMYDNMYLDIKEQLFEECNGTS